MSPFSRRVRIPCLIILTAGKIGDTRPALKLGATKEKFEEQAATFFH
jgi:hypothetical protein